MKSLHKVEICPFCGEPITYNHYNMRDPWSDKPCNGLVITGSRFIALDIDSDNRIIADSDLDLWITTFDPPYIVPITPEKAYKLLEATIAMAIEEAEKFANFDHNIPRDEQGDNDGRN